MDLTFSPRIVSNIRADFFTIESFLQFKKFKDARDEELILAIYDYLTDMEDGSYHWWDMEENKGEPTIKGRVIDPVKLFNVYGFQICGQMAFSLYRIYITAGYQARVFGAPGHTISEVFYNNSWHFLDVDMWAWFKNKNGQIASAYELSQDAFQLILHNQNKSNPCNLPDRSLEGYAEMFHELKTENGDIATAFPDYSIQSHTMDFHLRPGEKVIRGHSPQGRFHISERFVPKIKKLSQTSEWKGHPSERYEPFRTYGNGYWSYAPNLTEDTLDFESGVWSFIGVKPTKKGLEGNGHSVFRIVSPYIFCGIPKIMDHKIETSDGVFISIKGHGPLLLEITDQEGSWQTIKEFNNSYDEKMDITALMDGRYHCFIRFTQKSESVLEFFIFEGYIMTAPMALPTLKQGENLMQIQAKDKKQMQTIPYHIPIDFRENKGLLENMVSMQNGQIKVERPGWLAIYPIEENQNVQVVFKNTMPEGKKSLWCYLYGVFKETPYGVAHGRAKIEYSFDNKEYYLINERQLSQTRMYWDCSVDSEFVFKKPIHEIYFRLTSDTNISNFHCYHHLEEKPHQGELKVFHQYKEGGKLKTYQVPANQLNYVIYCIQETTEHQIIMKVDSIKKQKI